MNEYLKKILQAQVYEVAKETPLEKASILSKKLNNNIKIEYLELRNKNNLSPVFNKKNLKLFVCFYIKKVRLIDNF